MEALMASKVKVTVSLDEDLVTALSAAGRQTRKPRSRLVEEALVLWRRSQPEQALKEGYLAMAKEDRATAESHLPAGWEAVK
jgi:metal-responsive CopG/Arc/MetJ family transcriptional regulator